MKEDTKISPNMPTTQKSPKLKKDGTISRQGEGGGRPTLEELYPDSYLDKLADKLESFFPENPAKLWLFQFAIENNIPSDYLVDFAERNDKFMFALKKAKDWQTLRLTEKGFSNAANTGMAIFSLKNVSNWRDKQELSGDEKRPIKVHITDI
jgi:hypothetical protein